MGPVTVTTTDASGGAKNSSPIPMDWRTTQFSAGIGCKVTGTVSYSVQLTFDGTNWLESNLSAIATDAYTTLTTPVLQVRLHQASGTGSVTMTVLQPGPAGR